MVILSTHCNLQAMGDSRASPGAPGSAVAQCRIAAILFWHHADFGRPASPDLGISKGTPTRESR